MQIRVEIRRIAYHIYPFLAPSYTRRKVDDVNQALFIIKFGIFRAIALARIKNYIYQHDINIALNHKNIL